MSMKQMARDILASVHQTFCLPHNRTSTQIKDIKGRFVPEVIDRKRIECVSRSLRIPSADVSEFIDDYVRQLGDEETSGKRWNEICGSMMSVRDRLLISL